MKKRRPALAILLVLTLVPGLSGCWGARELNALSLVMGIGIDKDPAEPNMVFMTAQIVKPEALKRTSAGESGAQAKAYWNLESTGTTIFEATREYTHVTHNRLYNAHNEIILLGKDAAADGVQKYLDFFQRAQESRPTTEIAVSMTAASDALQIMPELDRLPAVNIAKLVRAQEYTSQSREVTLQDFTSDLLSKTKCPVAPLIWVSSQGGGENIIVVKGLAVFKGDRMAGQLDENETRGLLWVEGKVRSGHIEFDYLSGRVSMEIRKETTRVKPWIADGKIGFTVEIHEEGGLVSQSGAENLEKPPQITILENIEQEIIRQEVLNTVEKAKEMNADIFGFGEKLHHTHPAEWKALEDSWDQIFPLVHVDVKVECKIRSAGNITKPDRPE